MKYEEISQETAEYMGFLPDVYKETLKEFEGEYVFGKTIDSRIEKRYFEKKTEMTRKYKISENGLVKVPVSWLEKNGFK